MKKICFIFNLGPHYRFPIYNEMGKELDCDIYLGDKVDKPLKTFDYVTLEGYKATLTNHFFGHFFWQSGTMKLLFLPYRYYIIGGSPYCINDWIFLIVGKLLNKKVISWSHGWKKDGGLLMNFVKKRFFSLFYYLMIYGEYAIDFMSAHGIERRKMVCIANSLDSKRNQEIRKTLKECDVFAKHFGNAYPVVIFSGRIQKSKKVELLLEAISLIKKSGSIVNIVLVGPVSYGYDIDRIVAHYGLQEQVWLYGECYDDVTLAKLFYNSTICVSPGPIGLLAIHALSFGCPVISHDNFSHQGPEFKSIQKGITGDFFEEDNVADLREKIEEWCSKSSLERKKIRRYAFEEIDRKWNVDYQIGVLKKVTTL